MTTTNTSEPIEPEPESSAVSETDAPGDQIDRRGALGATDSATAFERIAEGPLPQRAILLSDGVDSLRPDEAAIAARSPAWSIAMFSWTATIAPPTVSKSGVKPVSR